MAQADVTAARVAALAAYTAACEALEAAYVELRACDELSGSAVMGPDGVQRPRVASFIDRPADMELFRRHEEAAPNWPLSGEIEAAVALRVQDLRDVELAA